MIQEELYLDNHEFICPVTDEQILFEESPFEASAATVFCFIESINSFEFATDSIKLAYAKAKQKFKENKNKPPKEEIKYTEVKPTSPAEELFLTLLKTEEHQSEYFSAFELMLDELESDSNTENYVCYAITTSGMACGPSSFTVHIGIDMSYKPNKN